MLTPQWQQDGLGWALLAPNGERLGVVLAVDNPKVPWAALIRGADGALHEHGGYEELKYAKGAVEHFAVAPTVEAGAMSEIQQAVGFVGHPRVTVAADVNDAMREQLEFLVEHAQGGDCGCHQCERYRAVRALLLSGFEEKRRGASA